MRILVLSNLYPPDVIGGYELACSHAVGELRRRGHDVRVLTSAPRLPAVPDGQAHRILRFEDVYDAYLADHTPPQAQRLALARATLVSEHNIKLLRQEVDEFVPDLVYLWNLVGIGGLGLAFAVDLSGIPWAWHLMDAMPRDLTVAAGPRQQELAGLVGQRLQGTWISCSLGLLYEIEAAGAVLGDRVVVLPNWVIGKLPTTRRRWFKPGGMLRCIFAGRLHPDKGCELAIQSIEGVRDAGAGPSGLDIYGDGPERPRLEGLIRARHLESEVRVLGKVPHEELMRRLADYDVMIFPSAPREPFGLSAIEAAARGCVPIVTATTGITQWLIGGEQLLEVERDASSISATLVSILQGEIDLGAIGREGLRVIRRDFKLEKVMDHVEALLTETARDGAVARKSWADIERLGSLGERLAQVLIGAD